MKPPRVSEIASGLMILFLLSLFIWFFIVATKQGERCETKFPGSHLAGPMIHPRCEVSKIVGEP